MLLRFFTSSLKPEVASRFLQNERLRGLPAVMNPISKWYMKLATVGFGIGASMELFMIHTGFYDKVLALEAQQRAEALEAAKVALDAEIDGPSEALEAANVALDVELEGPSETHLKA